MVRPYSLYQMLPRAVRILALATALLTGSACSDGGGSSAGEGPPNVVLIVLDTTRADRLSAFGYDAPTSPHLAELAANAIAFDHAYATSCWTVASHASLFTGLLPVTHGATQEHVRLDGELETLAQLLHGRGYHTAAFSNNSWVSALTDLTRGFDEIFPMWREKPATDGGVHPTTLAVRAWLAERSPDEPFLLFVNLIEPHWPYDAPRAHQDLFIGPHVPEGYRRRSGFSAVRWYLGRAPDKHPLLATRSRMYDAELSYVDEVLGQLIDALRVRALLDESLVIVTADHGENLGEHGHQGHSFALYEPTLHIPLVVRPPGFTGAQRREDPVQLTDVFATIAKAAGATPRDTRVVGRDLLEGPLPPDRPIVAEYYRPDVFMSRFPNGAAAQAKLAPYRRRLRAIRVGDEKLIWASDGRYELYDLRADPEEERNLARRRPERVRLLGTQLGRLVEGLARPVEAEPLGELDPETEANLRALGYVP